MGNKFLINFCLAILFFFASCKRNEDIIELEILNEQLITYSEKYYGKYDTLNVIKYKLSNKSENDYFLYLNKHEVTPSITFDNHSKSLLVYEKSNGTEVKYSQNSVDDFYNTCSLCNISYYNKINNNTLLNELNKNYLYPNKNNLIFIHSGETLYLESLVKIQAYLPILNDINVDVAHIEKNKSYHAKMIMHPFKKDFNSYDWQTRMRIKENNFKMYLHKIESKNFVPIKIID